MNLHALKTYFDFTKSQRSGLISLFSIIIFLQIFYFFNDFSNPEARKEDLKWLSLQSEVDLLKKQKAAFVPKIYPFNPNFITDFKGYKLGMSVEEIDRLLKFREGNKYVNSAAEFQNVTKVSDSLLATMSPYFKFPDWVKNRKQFPVFEKKPFAKGKIVVKDINHATAEDLIKIYGIGPALSERILKQKNLLGGFVNMEQMSDVWGLSPEVVENLNKSFKVFSIPEIKKVNINKATIKELGQFPYFRYPLSKDIVTYRSMNGDIKNADLVKIKGFPVEKVSIIAVYLEF